MKSCRNLKQVSETRYKKFIFYSIFMAFPAYKTGISSERKNEENGEEERIFSLENNRDTKQFLI